MGEKKVPQRQDNCYLVFPAYNEEANIQKLLEAWYPVAEALGPESRILVLDDGSRDRTAEILNNWAQTHPQLLVYSLPNKGHGPTVLRAFDLALEQGADYVFQTDSDGQTQAEDFWKLWEARGDYELLAGRRQKREDGLQRRMVSWVLSLVLLLFYRVWVADSNVPFRLYPRGILEILLGGFEDRNFALPNACMMALSRRLNLRIRRIPIRFRPRQGGKNTINCRRIFAIGLGALKAFHRQGKNWRAYEGEARSRLQAWREGR